MTVSNKWRLFNPDSNHQSAPAGFTLIEVLISLVLLTVVLGALYSSFYSVQAAIERFDSVSLKYQEARSALDEMRREVESAIFKDRKSEDKPLTGTEFTIKYRDILGKDTSSIDLTSYSARGNLNRISYYIKQNHGQLDLIKSQSPHIQPLNEYTFHVMDGIGSFTVETLFNDKWVKTWDTDNTDELPEFVRITIEFNDSGRNVRLTEYARPRINRKL